MDFVGAFIILLGVALVLGVLGVVAVKNLIYICGPNEVLIFSGGQNRIEGKTVGYRVIKGGRALRVPLLERVDRIDLSNMIIDVAVTNAYSKGGIPLALQGVANVKVSGVQPALGNAIVRFMGKDRKELIQIAKDTLEGNLRGVLSQLTPEEVNNDKIAFAEKLLEEADHDLSKLGLSLDTLKIQNVSDDVGYLDSIGRQQTADVVRRARVAEAEAKAISVRREAENHEAARLSEIEAEMNITRAQIEKRIKDAQTKKGAMVAEQVGIVKAQVARAKAELDVQEARVEQVRRRLEADVIAPAQAEMQAQQSKARGDSAKIIEDGKATVAVLEEMIKTWKHGGDNARDIFLMQKLQTVMDSLVSTIDQVKVDRVTVLPAASDSTARKAVTLVEELKGALGVDLPALLEAAATRRGQLEVLDE